MLIYIHITPVLEVEHKPSVGINCDIINCCVPKGRGPFEVEDVELFEGEYEGAEGVCLIESAFSLPR